VELSVAGIGGTEDGGDDISGAGDEAGDPLFAVAARSSGVGRRRRRRRRRRGPLASAVAVAASLEERRHGMGLLSD
jgi:hypothetical protein